MIEGSEEHLQKSICNILQTFQSLYGIRFAHNNNNVRLPGKAGIIQGRKNKALGVKKGIPDLEIYLKNGRVIFIELKTQKGYLKPEQKDWRGWLEKNGFEWHLWRSVDDCLDFLNKEGFVGEKRSTEK